MCPRASPRAASYLLEWQRHRSIYYFPRAHSPPRRLQNPASLHVAAEWSRGHSLSVAHPKLWSGIRGASRVPVAACGWVLGVKEASPAGTGTAHARLMAPLRCSRGDELVLCGTAAFFRSTPALTQVAAGTGHLPVCCQLCSVLCPGAEAPQTALPRLPPTVRLPATFWEREAMISIPPDGLARVSDSSDSPRAIQG